MLRIFRQFLANKLHQRRSISAAILTIYIVSAAGIPLPSGASMHSGEPFPCANCECGCASPDQCWRRCCCHTLAERFSWAREHNVRPPDYAIAQARLAGLELSWLGIPKAVSHSGLSITSSSAKATNNSLQTCCRIKAATCCAQAEHCCYANHDKRPQKLNSADRIVAWRAMACHGQSLNWLAAVPTLIAARLEISNDLPFVAWLGPAASETAECLPTCPDVPPPQQA